ncbi:MAG: rhodanese-like domain-containing protein [Christensenellales bacterium]
MMKNFLFSITILMVFLLFLASCTATVSPKPSTVPAATMLGEAVSSEAYRTISPKQAKEMIAKEGVLLVDVRTPEEYAEGHIPGSILLPSEEITKGNFASVLPDKEAVTIVYCRSGRRSAIAAAELAKAGYTNVYDLGGIIDWPYETVTGK